MRKSEGRKLRKRLKTLDLKHYFIFVFKLWSSKLYFQQINENYWQPVYWNVQSRHWICYWFDHYTIPQPPTSHEKKEKQLLFSTSFSSWMILRLATQNYIEIKWVEIGEYTFCKSCPRSWLRLRRGFGHRPSASHPAAGSAETHGAQFQRP